MKIINNLKTYDHVPQVLASASAAAATTLSRRVTVLTGTTDGKDFVLPSTKGKRKTFTVLNLTNQTIKIDRSGTDTITNCAGVSQTTMNLAAAKGYTFEALGGIWYVTSTIVTAAT